MRQTGRFLLLLSLALALSPESGSPGIARAGGDGSKPGKKTIEGELVDSRCFLQQDARGEVHRGCAITCAKSGLPLGVATADGKYDTLAVQPASLANHAARTVRVTGLEKHATILPTKLEVKNAAGWQEVKLPEQMM